MFTFLSLYVLFLHLTLLGAFKSLQENFVSVILVGKTGAGKSSTANTLVSDEKFAVSGGTESVTKNVQVAEVTYRDKSYRIMDTPGYLDADLSPSEITDQISQWSRHSLHGIDVFLFLMEYGRVGSAHWESFQTFKNSFGVEAQNRTALLLTRISPPNLESNHVVGNMTACCKTGGAIRQTCCEVKEIKERGQPIVAVGDIFNSTRRRLDKQTIFDAIDQVKLDYPKPYSNSIFNSIKENRTMLLQEINMLKFNSHRRKMHALYESYYSPEIVDGTIPEQITTDELWIALNQSKAEEEIAHADEANKWGYRLLISCLIAFAMEWLLNTSHGDNGVFERLFRAFLFFKLYVVLCLTEQRVFGIRYFLSLFPSLIVFDITKMMDLYFKLDDVVPLFAAVVIHLGYMVSVRIFRYLFSFSEGIYTAGLLMIMLWEIDSREIFPAAKNEFPLEQAAFFTMAISTFIFFCRVDSDFLLDEKEKPIVVWRFRMAWRRPINSMFQPIPSGEMAIREDQEHVELKYRKVETPWDLECFRQERRERLSDLQNQIIVHHKAKQNWDTVRALEDLPHSPIELPEDDPELWPRIRLGLLASINLAGAVMLLLEYQYAALIAVGDLVVFLVKICLELQNWVMAGRIQDDNDVYKEEWVVCSLDLSNGSPRSSSPLRSSNSPPRRRPLSMNSTMRRSLTPGRK